MIYKRTKNIRVIQLLPDTKIKSTVRYLGIAVEAALEMAEQTETYMWIKLLNTSNQGLIHERRWAIRPDKKQPLDINSNVIELYKLSNIFVSSAKAMGLVR